MKRAKHSDYEGEKPQTDLPVVYWSTWWGVWGGGLGQISCPAAGWDPQAGPLPAGRTSPRPGFVSVALPGGREPGLQEKYLSLYGGS